MPNSALDLFIVRRFLPPELCPELIAKIDSKRRPLDLADDNGVPNFRTSDTCDLDAGDPVVLEVGSRICALLGIPPEHGEQLLGQRYAVGQEFKLHTDTFNPTGENFYVHCAITGQRTWTAMIYLNQPEEGGATRFKAIGKTVQAETGKLLAWNNLLPNGRPNDATLHQGMRVKRGTKYILTKWFRELPTKAAAG